jgi:hypothetical protein
VGVVVTTTSSRSRITIRIAAVTNSTMRAQSGLSGRSWSEGDVLGVEIGNGEIARDVSEWIEIAGNPRRREGS